MRLVPLVLLILCSLSMPASASAQQAPQRDPQAAAILARSFAVMGGGAVPSVRDIWVSGTVSAQVGENLATGTFELKVLGRDMIRTNIVLGAESVSRVTNGSRGMQVRGGKTQYLPYHATMNKHVDYLPVLTEAAEWNNPSFSVIYKGLDTVNGQTVYRIRVEPEFPGRPPDKAKILSELAGVDLFIDTSSYLLLKRARLAPSFGDLHNTLVVEHVYSDYRSFGGLMVPSRIAVYVRGQRISEIMLTSVVPNAGLSAAEFEVR